MNVLSMSRSRAPGRGKKGKGGKGLYQKKGERGTEPSPSGAPFSWPGPGSLQWRRRCRARKEARHWPPSSYPPEGRKKSPEGRGERRFLSAYLLSFCIIRGGGREARARKLACDGLSRPPCLRQSYPAKTLEEEEEPARSRSSSSTAQKKKKGKRRTGPVREREKGEHRPCPFVVHDPPHAAATARGGRKRRGPRKKGPSTGPGRHHHPPPFHTYISTTLREGGGKGPERKVSSIHLFHLLPSFLKAKKGERVSQTLTTFPFPSLISGTEEKERRESVSSQGRQAHLPFLFLPCPCSALPRKGEGGGREKEAKRGIDELASSGLRPRPGRFRGKEPRKAAYSTAIATSPATSG